MKICVFKHASGERHVGLVEEDQVKDLTLAGISKLSDILESESHLSAASEAGSRATEAYPLSETTLLAPIEAQEVWAAGVTYMRSKTARMEESDFSAIAYDKVYEAPRPEIFFKAVAEKVVGTGDQVGIRRDATWNVPEPELALVFNSKGILVGATIGNDMSSRDIEGENLLYLPQAKVYDRSAGLGPWIVLGESEEAMREWTVDLRITRDGEIGFEGTTAINQIKRSFTELKDYLFASQTFSKGAILMTGTGVVPGDDFTLQAGDVVRIEISGIGVLENEVTVV